MLTRILAMIILSAMTPFLGRTHFYITNLRIIGLETYIHFVAQENRIVRKLFIFNFFTQKGRNHQCKSCIFIGIRCNY